MAFVVMHSPTSIGMDRPPLSLAPNSFVVIAAFCILHPQVSWAECNALQQIVDCSEIVDEMQRLHCYDDIVNKIEEDPRRSVLTAASAAETVQSDVSLGEKYLTIDEPHQSGLESTMQLVQAYKDKQELWVFEFENGQIWQQLEARYLSVPKDYPAAVTISQGVFGSYDLRIGESGRTIKVKRLH